MGSCTYMNVVTDDDTNRMSEPQTGPNRTLPTDVYTLPLIASVEKVTKVSIQPNSAGLEFLGKAEPNDNAN
jgi:hypothetical protein